MATRERVPTTTVQFQCTAGREVRRQKKSWKGDNLRDDSDDSDAVGEVAEVIFAALEYQRRIANPAKTGTPVL